jgi:hypothetical protein
MNAAGTQSHRPAKPLDARRDERAENAHTYDSRDAAPAALEQMKWPCDSPTAAGGLLFLLPVLSRLNYPQWEREHAEWLPVDVARRVLALVCTRLAVPTEDLVWRLAVAAEPPRSPQRFFAPELWAHGIAASDGAWLRGAAGDGTRLYDATSRLLLAVWSRTRRPGRAPAWVRAHRSVRMADRSRRQPPLHEAVTEAWLTACRRWLRRYAGSRIASLVSRPARISMTPTHVDVHFELAAATLAIRRGGLDVDPGWVPWFGRVVHFHYETAWT